MSKPRFEASFNSVLHKYKVSAAERGYPWKLTKFQFKALTSGNCFYCNAKPSNKLLCGAYNGIYVYNGIDRINPTKGYLAKNCVPCCTICNRMKSKLTKNVFLRKIRAIYENLLTAMPT